MKKSPNDPKQYQTLTLANGLRILLVHNAESNKSAAALAVNVGHFDDPIHRQGLAHFLEHMLFLGSENYPDGSEYQKFISEHGGSNNAWTATEHTCFFFDIASQHFGKALARFGEFFTAPLLSEEFVNKERKNIDAEFKLKLKDDIRRLYDVHKETINQAHPFAKFSVGSSETLADKAGYNLRSEVCQFFQTHYQAHFMTLVLEGPQSLSELARLATLHFAEVQSNGIEKAQINQPLYHAEHQQKWISVQSVKNDPQLIISFAMPSIDHLYQQKPESILAYLIGHEGPGSILSLLKSKQWAFALTAGSGINGSNFKDFNINISLSPEGQQHITDIVTIVFSYLRLLKNSPINEQYYNEKKALAELSFTYQEKLSALDSACQLVINMQHYPEQDYIFGDYIMLGLEQDTIDYLLSYLVASNVRIIVINQDPQTQSHSHTSKWYQVPYSVIDIDTEQIKQWQNPGKLTELTLPKKNPYIVAQPELMADNQDTNTPLSAPEKISQHNGFTAWFKNDISFNTPKGYIYLSIEAPAVIASVTTIAMTRLFTDIYSDAVIEQHYDAELAGIHYHLYAHQSGLTLKLSGISTKQAQLLPLLLASLMNTKCSLQKFALFKQQLLNHWHNAKNSKSISQLFAHISATMQPMSPSSESLIQALEQVDLQQFTNFIARMFNNVSLDMLIHGNWTKPAADDIVATVKQVFNGRMSTTNQVKIPSLDTQGKGTLTIAIELPAHDHAAILYYPMPSKDLRTVALTMIVNQLLSPIFFQQMRTEKQYGYLVGVGFIPINRYPGIAFYIQSPHTDAGTLKQAMTAFIAEAKQYVLNLPNEHWQHLQAGLSGQLQEKDTNLRIKSQRYWAAICNQDTSFTQKQELINTIEGLSIDEVIAFIEQHFSPEKAHDCLALVSYENKAQLAAMKNQFSYHHDSEVLLKKYQRKY
ncbi:Secreted Zn-dependent peptidases, insulinase-like [Colwellia chukchiensis]|uniref:Protease 3 n=1 Tax=Colwellia chukchiensis TaxID=641665 RepID=A0A1H7H4I5_9GAMM|nr:insulinase family protein [Colwellia chukchiensis]SEK45138.1 Secreted Zn-dependent peptidases, insulinase-like [Colwellia chukchiensis]